LHSANAVDIPGNYFHARVPSNGLKMDWDAILTLSYISA